MKSREQHLRDGTYRADRHGNEPEFPVLDNIPDPPDKLSKEEAVYWYRYCTILDEMGLLSDVFLITLVDLCRVEVLKNDLLSKADAEDSGEQINRILGDAVKAQDLALRLRAKLGLTPVDARKVSVKPKRKDNPFDLL
jgi:phage terminase small subunit